MRRSTWRIPRLGLSAAPHAWGSDRTGRTVRALRRSPNCGHGTASFFVTGNHEYISGADPWGEKVVGSAAPLENALTELPGFDLAGVADV
ncbi:hypothetical protein ABT009_33885 [Streptomyces sp. NPDC002896]|uniref:hypothetical protein n=1 Tax=Streptomyces sp. NPDC002896 TaxID=3154438 RepID=UPI0033215FA6